MLMWTQMTIYNVLIYGNGALHFIQPTEASAQSLGWKPVQTELRANILEVTVLNIMFPFAALEGCLAHHLEKW